jgi:hypothetical protein
MFCACKRFVSPFAGLIALFLLNSCSPRSGDLSELLTILRMTVGVTDPTKMVFVKDARDAKKVCECPRDCNVFVGRGAPVEVVGLKSALSSGGQCELISYRLTKAGANAADRNGIRGPAFALFRMNSQDVIRRYAPATFRYDRAAEAESIAYCMFAPARTREIRLASVQFTFTREELQVFSVRLLAQCPADPVGDGA